MDGVGGRVGDANVDSSGDPATWKRLCGQVWVFPQVRDSPVRLRSCSELALHVFEVPPHRMDQLRLIG